MYKVILKHAPKYLTGSVITSAITLLMTKYYTVVFTPAEFGVLALYLVMFNYIKTFVSLSMDSSATRFYFDYRESRRDEYLSTIFWFISAIALVVFLLGLFLKDSISSWIAPNSENVYIVTLLTGIVAVYVSFLTRILYNEHKSTSVLKHSVFQTFVNHISSVIFISVFNFGILGRVGGQGLGYTLNVITLLKEFYSNNLFKLKMTFNKLMAKEIFMLALPTLIASFQNVVFIYLDRIFIKHFIGDSAVGVYTLGYMLGKGLSLIFEAVSQAILPKVYKDMNNSYNKAIKELEYFSFRYYMGLVIITLILSFLSPLIIELLSNDSYAKASTVMPFVLAGFMMGGFYKIPSLVLGYHKIVWFYPILSILSFGLNALLNWYLIPKYGIMGAGFASFVGLFLYSLIMQILVFKFMSKQYFTKILIQYLFILLAIYILFIRTI